MTPRKWKIIGSLVTFAALAIMTWATLKIYAPEIHIWKLRQKHPELASIVDRAKSKDTAKEALKELAAKGDKVIPVLPLMLEKGFPKTKKRGGWSFGANYNDGVHADYYVEGNLKYTMHYLIFGMQWHSDKVRMALEEISTNKVSTYRPHISSHAGAILKLDVDFIESEMGIRKRDGDVLDFPGERWFK